MLEILKLDSGNTGPSGPAAFFIHIYVVEEVQGMKKIKKLFHERIGLLSLDGSEIVGYGHLRHRVGECRWCDFIRVHSITREFIRRLDLCEDRITRLNMWSLGTSLVDNTYNRKVILHWFRLFALAMRGTRNWRPVFRVLESGRRHLLHFHVIVPWYVDHSIVLGRWRALTGELSNVHVSGGPKYLEPRFLCKYLLKYLGKVTSTYRWMGPFYGMGWERSRRVSHDAPGRVYGGVCCGGYTTEEYITDACNLENTNWKATSRR